MHNDSDDDDDDDNTNTNSTTTTNNNNYQDLYICATYHDKITQRTLHQTLRSTIKVRKSMHNVMYSNLSTSFV
jgi:hypothetical protein